MLRVKNLVGWGVVLVLLCALPGFASASEDRLEPGISGMAGMDFADGSLWVISRTEDTISEVDAKSGKVLSEMPCPCAEAGGLAISSDYLWCLDTLEAKVYEVDRKNQWTVRSVDVNCSLPQGLAFDGTSLWVGCQRKNKLLKIDPSDGTTLKTIPTPYKGTSGLAWGADSLWVTDRVKDQVYQVETRKGWVLNALELELPYPRGIAHDGTRVWVADYQEGFIQRIDLDLIDTVNSGSERPLRVVFTHEMRNNGPDVVDEATIYVALPVTRNNQDVKRVEVVSNAPEIADAKDEFESPFKKVVFENLAPGKSFWVKVEADAVLKKVHYVFDLAAVLPLDQVPEDVSTLYLRDEDKYDVANPRIQKAAKKIVGAETNPYMILLRVFHYVTRKMDYKLSGGWNAAPYVLKRKSGSCSEYSILTIALLRASGIPARYVGAYVVRGEDASVDYVFHRWVEAYLPGIGWIPLDPTKGDAPTPAEQFEGVGDLDQRFLVTTVAGGDSDILGWQYNSVSSYSFTGRVSVAETTMAEWMPLPGSFVEEPVSPE